MEQENFCICLGNAGKEEAHLFRHTLIVTRQERAGAVCFGRKQKGESYVAEVDFVNALEQYYREIKKQRVDKLRYFIFADMAEETDTEIICAVAETIHQFHQEASTLPLFMETLMVLPSHEASRHEKARCFSVLDKIENTLSKTGKKLFDLIWLFDTDFIAPEMLVELLRIYLSTDMYYGLNSQVLVSTLQNRFRESITAFSSMGWFKLIFSVELWQRFLSLKLEADILSLPRLSPAAPTQDGAKTAVSTYTAFIERTSLSKLVLLIHTPKKMPGTDEIISTIAEEAGGVADVVDKFLSRLDLLIQREDEGLREKGGGARYEEDFLKAVEERVIDVMDNDAHGPFSSLSFISLLLGTYGVYSAALIELEKHDEKLPRALTLPGTLLGWFGNSDSPTLRLVFQEMMKELNRIYEQCSVPLCSCSTWDELSIELERVINLTNYNVLFGTEATRIGHMTKLAARIIEACHRPYSKPLVPSDIRTMLQFLTPKEELVLALQEKKAVEAFLTDIEERINALGWRWIFPSNWGYFSKRSQLRKQLEKVKQTVVEEAAIVAHKRETLLPVYVSLFIYHRLHEAISRIETEICGFTDSILERAQAVNREMNEMDFSSSPIVKQIATKSEEDISRLYYTCFTSQQIPALFEKEFFGMMKSPQQISIFYPEGERDRFFTGLRLFCTANFLWLFQWNAEKIIHHLGKTDHLSHNMISSCRPFLNTKDYPDEKVVKGIYVGLKNPSETKLSCTGNFFTTDNPWEIVGLNISHGFPLFAVEGWEYWKRCYEELHRYKS